MKKFKIGDKVRIINYGHKMWNGSNGYPKEWLKGFKTLKENKNITIYDISQELIGEIGIIENISSTQKDGIYQYSLKMRLPTMKSAWYNENQLELYETD